MLAGIEFSRQTLLHENFRRQHTRYDAFDPYAAEAYASSHLRLVTVLWMLLAMVGEPTFVLNAAYVKLWANMPTCSRDKLAA